MVLGISIIDDSPFYNVDNIILSLLYVLYLMFFNILINFISYSDDSQRRLIYLEILSYQEKY